MLKKLIKNCCRIIKELLWMNKWEDNNKCKTRISSNKIMEKLIIFLIRREEKIQEVQAKEY
jgi:hypothetical protein